MKNIFRITAFLIAILMLLSGCKKADDKDKTETTVKKTETSAVTTAKKEETTAPTEETTQTVTTTADTTTLSENGKPHVESISLDKYEVNLVAGQSDMPMVTMLPDEADNKSEIWESSNNSVATVNAYGRITGVSKGECTVTVTSADNTNVKAQVKVKVTGEAKDTTAPKPQTNVTNATYIQGILIANKTYALPADYNPGVDPTANAALTEMINGAAAEGVSLWIASSFRSYEKQTALYNNYVARDGKAEADRYSARPGHSEHQTGLAFDLNSLEQSFGETREGKWIAANCWKYGFILRYPQNKEAQTGYMYEPWHVRYVGKDTAKSVYDSGLCLEEYLGITSVYSN